VNPQTRPVRKARRFERSLPGFVRHASFARPTAEEKYDPRVLLDDPAEFPGGYMPDELSREHVRRMHYAAFRMHAARTRRELAHWRDAHLALRDRVVVGNRKLIFRAVRSFPHLAAAAEDYASDLHIVLIQAVVAYNPWIGIRFSTYAYTCLLRALGRLSRKAARDWTTRALSFDAFLDGEPPTTNVLPARTGEYRLDEFFRADHPLLSEREKLVMVRRFNLNERTDGTTLEQVGAELGLSKERVRQVQAAAIGKLRQALTVTP
jgi:RNA polymerase sigma factor (sigma-70 family)